MKKFKYSYKNNEEDILGYIWAYSEDEALNIASQLKNLPLDEFNKLFIIVEV